MIPVAPNSEPATEMEEIVTPTRPEEVKVTDRLPVLPTATFPNDSVVVLKVRAGVVEAEAAIVAPRMATTVRVIPRLLSER